MDQPPSNMKTAAIIQIVSGILSMSMMCFISSFVWSTVGGLVTGICTLGMFPIGVFCGFLGYLLIPIGLFEIISGILGLANPKGAGSVMKICSFIEIGSLLAGGLTTAIAGMIAMNMMNHPEVVAYLEG